LEQFFISTHTNRIDRKGRVSVPADFRAVLARRGSGDAVLLFPSLDQNAIDGAGEDYLAELNRRIETLPPLSPERDYMIDAVMPLVRRLALDGEGRILLPEELIAHAGLDDAAVFVGRYGNFQIWRPDRWQERQRDAIEKSRALIRSGGRG
jgi:MraZ protein